MTKSIKWIAGRLRRHREETSKHPEDTKVGPVFQFYLYRLIYVSHSSTKRRKEFDEKMSEAVSSLFGDYVNEMWFVENLGVEPSSQHQGYGGALLESVTFLVCTSETKK